MTYLKDGTEYLDNQELKAYQAVRRLNAARRTTNNSQVAASSGLSRATAARVCQCLRARGFLVNVSRGAAYHWRVTGQPVPYPAEARDRDRTLRDRQRELNAQIRNEN